MATQLNPEMAKLYQEDFMLWVDETVKRLKQRDLNGLDWEHLIEEIEGLGSEQRHKVDSYLLQLLVHLLLYRYWESEKADCAKGWQNEIANFRIQLEILFDSQTLQNYFLERVDYIYPKVLNKFWILNFFPKIK